MVSSGGAGDQRHLCNLHTLYMLSFTSQLSHKNKKPFHNMFSNTIKTHAISHFPKGEMLGRIKTLFIYVFFPPLSAVFC